jgi:hypothetical protein
VLLRELFTDQGAGTMIVRQPTAPGVPVKAPANVARQRD